MYTSSTWRTRCRSTALKSWHSVSMRASLVYGAAAVLLSSVAWLWASQSPASDSGTAIDSASMEQRPESGSANTEASVPNSGGVAEERGLKDSATSFNSSLDQTATRELEASSQGYVWPSGAEVPVMREFNNPEQRWLSGHRGVDLAMAKGQSVLASGAGTIVYAGRLNDRNVISIEHSNGLRTTYEPVSPLVKKGDLVAKGQEIGTLELGHIGELPVLHWGAKYPDDRYINPLSLVDWSPIRLWE